ncbi:MAG: ATPase, T2SS/T4P/T4SS family [Polyangiaceae bacterium]|jgi:pilus assembly protein CpaF
MFTIVISEKGGAERREAFDKNEISVGRVQGNDLMLPKGNVSKHHARLLSRDGRFIVTDLRSTNGTYVNGRKISQATMVREGDKIYVGDFVLRLEAAQFATAAVAQSSTDGAAEPQRGSSAQEPVVPAATPDAASQPAAPVNGPAPVSIPAAPRSADGQNVSHYPLEQDPDSESAPGLAGAAVPSLPGPPRLPQAVDLRLRPAGLDRVGATPHRAGPPSASRLAAGQAPELREAPDPKARRVAFVTLVSRIGDALERAGVDAPLVADHGERHLAAIERIARGQAQAMQAEGEAPEGLDAIERIARDQAQAMQAEGEAPEGVDVDLLVADAVREIAGLGPLGAPLGDEETSEIHVDHPDRVLVIKKGRATRVEPGFTNEKAVWRVLSRLASQSGEPLRAGEAVVERRLAHGEQLMALGPPATKSWVITIRKPRRIEMTLDALVRAGAMSHAMQAFLEACVHGRANLLVVGSSLTIVAPVIAALLASAPAGDRSAVFQDLDEIVVPSAEIVVLDGRQRQGALSIVARLGAKHVGIGRLGGALSAAAVVDAIAEGLEGIVAGVVAPTLRHGLARTASQIALEKPGVSAEAAREAVSEAFDAVLEVGRGAEEGTSRVHRIAELAGSEGGRAIGVRDLFTSNADAIGEPAFMVTGATPRLASDFAARGIRLDAGLFRRAR